MFQQFDFMAKLASWECPQCGLKTHYKGLCRECTEYDETGTPVKPVYRVRVNHTQTERHVHIPTKADFVNSRRRQPSKRQLEKMKEMLNATSRRVDGEGEDSEGDFMSIGEIVAKVEEE